MTKNADDRERELRSRRKGHQRLEEQRHRPPNPGLPYCNVCEGWHSPSRGCR